MSDPQNILSQYRSYSYHHILIACDNDAAADYLSSSEAKLSTFRQLGSRRPVQVERRDAGNPETVQKLDIGNYVVILNGMIDTQYVVQNAEWFSATAASTDSRDRFNSMAVEGTIEVQEPRGVRFFNAINNAADQLGSDPNGLIFLLKTIFIGYGVTSRGEETTSYITNIKPLRFIMYDITGTFSNAGGNYIISFVGASDGASRLPQYSRVTEEISFEPGDENADVMKLSDAMTRLADIMSTQAEKNRECVVKNLKETYGNPTRTVTDEEGKQTTRTLDDLRVVKYEIKLDEAYDDEYIIDGLIVRQSDNTEGGIGPLKFGPNSTVEQAIRACLDRCSKIREDRTVKDGEDVSYIYKIRSQISMVGQGDEGASRTDETAEYGTVLVKYTINRFAQFSNQTIEKVLNRNQAGDENDELSQAIIDQNTIEFDYFFTGKNIDIIDFDIKMEMGLAFLQALSTTNTLPTQIEQITASGIPERFIFTSSQENQKGEGENTIVIRSQTPIFPSTRVKDVGVRNTTNPEAGALFQAYLSRHAALENLEANVTIHGNPYLMSRTNRQASDTTRKQNVQGEEGDTENIMENWGAIPGLVKINIFMPATSDTPSSNESFQRERFWYNGYYYLYGIQHKFQEGQFTQDLQLLSLPNESLVESQNKEVLDACGVPEQPPEESEGESGETTDAPTRQSQLDRKEARTGRRTARETVQRQGRPRESGGAGRRRRRQERRGQGPQGDGG